jgi:hypothetical protein
MLRPDRLRNPNACNAPTSLHHAVSSRQSFTISIFIIESSTTTRDHTPRAKRLLIYLLLRKARERLSISTWLHQEEEPTRKSTAYTSEPYSPCNPQITTDTLPSFSLTTFSPSGKLVQIEHALAAVAGGTASLGIKGE